MKGLFDLRGIKPFAKETRGSAKPAIILPEDGGWPPRRFSSVKSKMK